MPSDGSSMPVSRRNSRDGGVTASSPAPPRSPARNERASTVTASRRVRFADMRLARSIMALSAGLLTACLPGGKSPREMTDAEYLRSRELMVPVHGVSRRQLRDTYSAPRSGGRAHLALDIMAKKGTRVLSADDGVV